MMNSTNSSMLAVLTLCLVGVVTACHTTDANDEADSQSSQEDDKEASAKEIKAEDGSSDFDLANADDDRLPLEGIYKVRSYTRNDEGCELTEEPEYDDDYFKLSVTDWSGMDIAAFWIYDCDSPSENDCDDESDEAVSRATTSEEYNSFIDGDIDVGTVFRDQNIYSAGNLGGDDANRCQMSAISDELEITDDGIVVRQLDLELDFDVGEEDWPCTSTQDMEESLYEAMECGRIEFIEGKRIK